MHLAPYVIDELACELLAPEDAEPAREHLASCPECTGRLAEAQQARARFLQLHPPRLEAERLLEHSRPALLFRTARWWAPAAAAMVLAVAAWWQLRPAPPDWLAKGAGGISVSVLRPPSQVALPLEPGSKIQAGDRLQLAVQPGGFELVSVFAVGPQGLALLWSGPPEQPLPFSLTVDDAPGPERLVVVLSRGPVAPQAIAPLVGRDAADFEGGLVRTVELPKR